LRTLDEFIGRDEIHADSVLVASDVHAGDEYQGFDPHAWETALDLAEKHDVFLVVGDLLDPRADEDVVTRVASSLSDLDANTVVIPGNHDTLDHVRVLERHGVDVRFRKYRRRGRGCPPGHSGPSLGGPIDLDLGVSFLVVHGHEPCGELGLEPMEAENPVAKSSPMPKRDQILDNYACRLYEIPGRMREIARSVDAEVVVTGHTHCRFLGSEEGTLLVNVGTTACPATCTTCMDPLNVFNVCRIRVRSEKLEAKIINLVEGRVIEREEVGVER